MKIYLNQLPQALKNPLAPVYLISGDVPLLIEETRDQVRALAEKNGFSEYKLFQAEKGFSWESFLAEVNSLSLFSDKTLLDCRLLNVKLGDKGNEALLHFITQAPTDKLLIITCPKLDAAAQKIKWVAAAEKQGVMVTIWPIEKAHYPAWLSERLKRVDLATDQAGLQMLAELTEGNLLSAKQAIEKLSLLYGKGKISTEEIINAISDSAKFNVFHLIDHAMLSNKQRVIRILSGLKEEGMDPILVLWALAREIRNLSHMAFERTQSQTLPTIFQQFKVWEKRKPLVKAALERHTFQHFLSLLQKAHEIDTIIKGIKKGDPWDELLNLSLALA